MKLVKLKMLPANEYVEFAMAGITSLAPALDSTSLSTTCGAAGRRKQFEVYPSIGSLAKVYGVVTSEGTAGRFSTPRRARFRTAPSIPRSCASPPKTIGSWSAETCERCACISRISLQPCSRLPY